VNRKSPAMQLIKFVSDHKMTKCAWSRERAQHIDDWAWELAIRGGFEFHRTDFGEPKGGIGEAWYAAAIEEGNMSAVLAMEHTAQRKPFIALEVATKGGDRRMAHMAGTQQEGRLSVGARFRWDGKWVTVTSFAGDNSYVVACSYPVGTYQNLPNCKSCGQPRYDQHQKKPDKPDHIYKITVEELRAGRTLERKKHPKCKLCLKPIAEGKEICGEEHPCSEWLCKKIIGSLAEGKRISCDWSREKVLLCNECIAKKQKEEESSGPQPSE